MKCVGPWKLSETYSGKIKQGPGVLIAARAGRNGSEGLVAFVDVINDVDDGFAGAVVVLAVVQIEKGGVEVFAEAFESGLDVCLVLGGRTRGTIAGDRTRSSTAGDRTRGNTAGDRARRTTAGDRAWRATAGNRTRSSTAGDRTRRTTVGAIVIVGTSEDHSADGKDTEDGGETHYD